MADDYETILTFRKSKYFWKFLNRQMVITDVDTLNDSDYELLLFSSMPENFQNCIDVDTGCIDLSTTGLTQITTGFTRTTFSVDIRWIDEGENGFSIYVAEDVDIPISDDVTFYVKGVAVVMMQRHMICAASGVAAGCILPVDVLMKSAPASIARKDASSISAASFRAPVSRITFRCTVGLTVRMARPISTISRSASW